jgi:predicted ATP-dependent endonuclease of OLD family
MRLKSFQIQNYKSIIDSGECRLSDVDNILVLAGQNESGKSAILQALYDYERGKLLEDCERTLDGDNFLYPRIRCTYTIEKGIDFVEPMSDDSKLPEDVLIFLKNLNEISIVRQFYSRDKAKLVFDEKLLKEYEQFAEKNRPLNEETSLPGGQTKQPIDTKQVQYDLNNAADEIWQIAPKIIFFDDFCDLLPDKIFISALKNKQKDAKGYSAVKNVEKILGADFTKYDSVSDAVRESRRKSHNKKLTADFNERWKQKIFDDNKVEIVIDYNQGRNPGQSYFNFFVLTKDGEYLAPQQRSKGLIWFLSFYLQLTAESKSTDDLIILFDEPGLYLHSKAQGDIKSLFDELAQKDQIIYSTHSPYLIDADKLHRLRLVINSRNGGTTIEKITTNYKHNQKDALKPIIDAIGLEIAHHFSCAVKKNVILEGISDHYYLVSMKKLYDIKDNFAFLPSMGASNAHLLMELCIGWGLQWLIIFDEDGASKTALAKIKKEFFNNDDEETMKKIYRIEGVEGIEDVFTLGDLRLVDAKVQNDKGVRHSQLVKEYGGKELFARLFNEKVNNGEITLDKISKTAKDHFKIIFDFINKGFGS